MAICHIIACVGIIAGLVYVIIKLLSESGINTALQNITSLSEDHQVLITYLEKQSTQLIESKSKIDAQMIAQHQALITHFEEQSTKLIELKSKLDAQLGKLYIFVIFTCPNLLHHSYK